MSEYRVGTTILHDGKPRLITRIVDSKSYFEDRASGGCYVMDELYLELVTRDGNITFLPLREHREDVEKDDSTKRANIKGPQTLEWRKLGKANV